MNTIDYSYNNWEPEILKDDLGSEVDDIIKRVNTDVQSLVYVFNNVILDYNSAVNKYDSGNKDLRALKVYGGRYNYQKYEEKLKTLKTPTDPIDKVVEESYLTIEG